jgi:DNA mismatch endonuclease (patch repair protein)
MNGQSWASSAAVRASMLGNRSRDTAPELALRRAVWALGLRFRVCARPLPGVRRTADLVFTRARVAVFLDGCFWHACPDHYRPPAANGGYWRGKAEANRARDAGTDQALRAAGWEPLRVWEHEDAAEAAARVAALVVARRRPNGGLWRPPPPDIVVPERHGTPRAARPKGTKIMGKYGEGKSQRGFVIDDVVWNGAAAVAAERGESVSEVIRKALEKYSGVTAPARPAKEPAPVAAAKKPAARKAAPAKKAPAKRAPKKAPAFTAEDAIAAQTKAVSAAAKPRRRTITAKV